MRHGPGVTARRPPLLQYAIHIGTSKANLDKFWGILEILPPPRGGSQGRLRIRGVLLQRTYQSE